MRRGRLVHGRARAVFDGNSYCRLLLERSRQTAYSRHADPVETSVYGLPGHLGPAPIHDFVH